MKETSSPFSAMTTKERLEQWNHWHSQHQEEMVVSVKPTDENQRSESVLHQEKPTNSRSTMKPHHSQYDAVVNRLRRASGGAGRFQSCSEVESTRQDASGKP